MRGGNRRLRGPSRPELEQRLLLLDLCQLTLQIVYTLLQPLVVEAKKIETVQQLLTLDIRPFQRALQSGQFKLCLLPVLKPGTHAYASVDRHPSVIGQIVAHSWSVAERLVIYRQRTADREIYRANRGGTGDAGGQFTWERTGALEADFSSLDSHR